jgi:hypothetical protein
MFMQAGRILLVAPDEELRGSVAFSLRAHGYHVVAVHRMDEVGPAEKFDCSLVDEPALSGFESEVTAFCTLHSPALLLAYSAAARRHPGFFGVIDKPLRGEDIVSAVRSVASAK